MSRTIPKRCQMRACRIGPDERMRTLCIPVTKASWTNRELFVTRMKVCVKCYEEYAKLYPQKVLKARKEATSRYDR